LHYPLVPLTFERCRGITPSDLVLINFGFIKFIEIGLVHFGALVKHIYCGRVSFWGFLAMNVKRYGGRAIGIAAQCDEEVSRAADRIIFAPPAPELLLPILEAVPLQLFAYHFLSINGYDVDHPRHLVKAVTRE